MADAIQQAIEMPSAEQRQRMRALRSRVMQNDVHYWTQTFLGSLGIEG
jgi:trehalose-6-phosphate synthase